MINHPHLHHPTGNTRGPVLVLLGIAGLSAALFFAVTLPKIKESRRDQAESARQAAAEQAAESAAKAAAAGSSGQTPAAPPPTGVRSKAAQSPAQVLESVAKGLVGGSGEVLLEELGAAVVPPETLEKLNRILGEQGYQIDPENAVSEIGRQPNLQRWALNLKHKDNPNLTSAIELDFARQPDGTWKPSRVRLPGDEGSTQVLADAAALDTALTFVQAVIRQDFAVARKFVDQSRVNDATIAGLCILFEEGAFRLKKEKPLVATVAKPNVSWFLAQVTSDTLQTESRFGMVLQRAGEEPWRVVEINLDRILSVYASRFGEGDIYFTPLVRNPKGGDSVVLYFTYNSAELHPRTKRQLEIVANILKVDPSRKLKIWGHTDAKGTDAYNDNLSMERAHATRDALVAFGVPPDQVSVEGFGASRPRRANFNPDGSDNPEGRRVNRRAEIYLDF